jgi:hypothetical protein
MPRSYSKHTRRTTRRRLRQAPTARVGRRCSAAPSPRRGWTCWTLEMAGSLISTGLLKIISNRHGENAKKPGTPPLPDFQGHFRGHEGRLDCWRSRAARRRVEPSSDEAPAIVSHPVEPTLPPGIARPIEPPGCYNCATPARAQSSSCRPVPPLTPQAPSTTPLRMIGTAPWPMIMWPPSAAAIPRGVG